MRINQLIKNILHTHDGLQQHAVASVNKFLTIRNWLFGLYIVEYEQNGKDRAQYGDRLLDKLEVEFKKVGIPCLTSRRFREYRQFYHSYPQIRRTLSAELVGEKIWQTLSAKSKSLPQWTDNKQKQAFDTVIKPTFR